MRIKINNRETEVKEGETLIEVARREGFTIPSLCYFKGVQHKSSCMVCAVKNCTTGQIIPSCTTLPTEGMQIETDSEEVVLTRTLSLELLLSDHRADCEAPCKVACPGGLDVAAMNRLYDQGKFDEALTLLRDSLVIPATLCYICNAPCEKICRKGAVNTSVAIREIKKALVAKTQPDAISTVESNGKKIAVVGSDPAALSAAYHLRKLGYGMKIVERSSTLLIPYIQAELVPEDVLKLETDVLKKMGIETAFSEENPALDHYDGVIATMHENPDPRWITLPTKTKQPARLVLEGRRLAERMHASLSVEENVSKPNDKVFNSTYTRFSDSEKKALEEQLLIQHNKSGCLYCDCDKKTACKLRCHATEYGVKSSRYTKNSTFDALKRQHVIDKVWFEQAKCIRCGLCVYNSQNGFTFKDRGFVMQVVLPEENSGNINELLTELCPTGALYIRE